MGGGTEAFPELGRHCEHPDCNQLDFLPFDCDGCHQLFCLEHRSYKSHGCAKSDFNSRKVVVCEICSTAIETTGFAGEDERSILMNHERSKDCDPRKKKKPTCPVRRCREKLTFSNTATCKTCELKVCLKHRFPADHECKPSASTSTALAVNGLVNRFWVALGARNATDCAKEDPQPSSSSRRNPFVKGY
ncbi:Zinc finger family protein [Tripterygium wilfordii]|uniref:Zinc finger family protein n=2 Tax=Tripterygium wilfordii TaxID=458696 RepID=A0A7J7CZV1_TRIWF|nr:Zinc finger family protein [Tripterygium wilfordii]